MPTQLNYIKAQQRIDDRRRDDARARRASHATTSDRSAHHRHFRLPKPAKRLAELVA